MNRSIIGFHSSPRRRASAQGLGALALSLLLGVALSPAAAQAQEAALQLNMPAQSLESALVDLATRA